MDFGSESPYLQGPDSDPICYPRRHCTARDKPKKDGTVDGNRRFMAERVRQSDAEHVLIRVPVTRDTRHHPPLPPTSRLWDNLFGSQLRKRLRSRQVARGQSVAYYRCQLRVRAVAD